MTNPTPEENLKTPDRILQDLFLAGVDFSKDASINSKEVRNEALKQLDDYYLSLLPERKVDNKRWEAQDRAYMKNQIYSLLDMHLEHDTAIDEMESAIKGKE